LSERKIKAVHKGAHSIDEITIAFKVHLENYSISSFPISSNKLVYVLSESTVSVYISELKLHLHGLIAPASRRMRATLTEAEPLAFSN